MERRDRTCYEVLGLNPGAVAEQVERAYRFYRDLYRENSLATYSLLSPEELSAARTRVQEAYEVLGDPARRLAYDVALGLLVPVPGVSPPVASEPIADPLPPPAAVPVEVPPAPDTSGELATASGPVLLVPPPVGPPANPEPPPLPEPVTGAALKAYRVAKGVSLRDIANQSKIGVRFLEYLEADRFRDLPAPVYIRGFLREYARACGLEPVRIVDSYLSRFGNA
jgi:flagellar biosynthesis protein FlhG